MCGFEVGRSKKNNVWGVRLISHLQARITKSEEGGKKIVEIV